MTIISGQVHDHAGRGVPGVFVSAAWAGGRRFAVLPSTYTDLSGRWWLDLPAGRWTVRESGHRSHDVTVGDTPLNVTFGEQGVAATQTAPDPTPEDIARFLERRKATRAEPVTRNEPEELPVTGDVGAMLRAQRGE